MNKKILFLLLLLYSITYSFSEVIWVHPNTMNITNSTGGDIFNVNDTINFTALPVDSLANDILNKGYIKWDFGDLTETDYGRYIKITHKYLFPFIYPVAWCGYLNNSDYPKSLTFNWIVVGDPKNVTYIFNGSPNNPKDSWSVEYNKSSNLVVINYYFDRNVNKNFTGINLGGELATISVDHNNIVAGDNVTFSYSIDKNIIFQMWSFGDGTISFEKSPTHTYKNPGFYFPRVLLVDDNGYIYVGYYRIYVKRPIGGYFEPIRNMSYVYNSSGAVNIEDIYAMAYKVGDNI
ncbi:PKD domain-containing protein, partial [Methanocaldococcus sp.]